MPEKELIMLKCPWCGKKLKIMKNLPEEPLDKYFAVKWGD